MQRTNETNYRLDLKLWMFRFTMEDCSNRAIGTPQYFSLKRQLIRQTVPYSPFRFPVVPRNPCSLHVPRQTASPVVGFPSNDELLPCDQSRQITGNRLKVDSTFELF